MVLAYADPRILGREEEAGSPLSRELNAGLDVGWGLIPGL